MGNNCIRLYLITGFLGSGKTTFIKRLMEYFTNRKIGIIMNEFGKIGIDGTLIKKKGVDMLEINNGSIFCSCLKGSFIDGLAALSGLPIDFLLVESSGLSDPSNIDDILSSVERLKGKVYEYAGSICVVDGVHFLDQAELLTVIERQITSSDFIIINKTDLITEEEISEIEEKIHLYNPNAQIVKTSYCQFSYDLLEKGLLPGKACCGKRESTNVPGNRPYTLTLKSDGIFQKEKLLKFLKGVSKYTYRSKGFFLLEEGWHQIDTVGGRIDIKPADKQETPSTLVIISSIGLPVIRKTDENWKLLFKEAIILR
ncbi:MAG TPA: CobW family GTP-binding protein [Clostridia bacterium]|nr:CobW family GTP-binding protein [Clostridia bacterium]